MKENKYIFILLVYLFYLSPIFDALTGFLVLNDFLADASLMTPSQIGKFVSVLLLIIYNYSKSKDKFFFLSIISIAVILLELISYLIFHNNLTGFLLSIVNFYKIFYLFNSYIFFLFLLKRSRITKKDLMDLFIRSGFLYASILIITTIFGMNTETYYEGSFGTKGVFASGNGLSVYLGAVSSISIFKTNSTRKKYDFFISLILVISSTIIGTKASIIFLLFNSLYIFILSNKFLKLLELCIVLLLVFYLRELFMVIFAVIIERYEKSESLIAFFSSGRQDYIVDALKQWKTDGLYSFRIFFGAGSYTSFRSSINEMRVFDTLERDIYDIFFMYGLIGVFFYFFYYFLSVIKIGFSNMLILLVFTMVFGYSFMAGHVVFNSMSGTCLVIIPLLVGVKDECSYDC